MNWKHSLLEHVGESLRFVSRAALLFNVIILTIFSTWFVFEFVVFSRRWLADTLFRAPW